jgi:predicted DNA-binding antitoxin AbrB/MazE fold protein
MSQTIRAIYENGVLRPLDTLSLSEREQVRITVESDSSNATSASTEVATGDPLAGLRVSTGISDLAENFDDYRFGKRRP